MDRVSPSMNPPTVATLLTAFATALVGDAVRGQAAWGYLQAATGLAIAPLSWNHTYPPGIRLWIPKRCNSG